MPQDADAGFPDGSWQALGLAAYDVVLGRAAGFRARPGQRAMAAACAQALAAGELGDTPEEPRRAVAVVQAGTGVGKSAAYITAGAAIAKARGTRLLISTSTVALQSQLLEKDLPALSAASPVPFTFALAKGRGRYVCKERLLREAKLETAAQDLLDFGELPAGGGPAVAPPPPQAADEARVRWWTGLADALATGGWDGDRDSLPVQPAPGDWEPVAAERHTCTARACPHFDDCAYYRARRRLADVDVIVANHDLLLASVSARVLPDLSQTLLVIDEAHHLPQKAVEQFAAHMDLTRLRWLERAGRVLPGVAGELQQALPPGTEEAVPALRAALHALAALLQRHGDEALAANGVQRLSEAMVHEVMGEPLRAVARGAALLLAAASGLGGELKARMREQPGATRLAALYAALGALAPPLAAAQETAERLLTEGEDARRTAKWWTAEPEGTGIGLRLHACPILPGELLRQHLWPRVRAAVLTSATLTSCGSFDFFLREAGLARHPGLRTLAVDSPFDHARQGAIVVRRTRHAPRALDAFHAEVASLLAHEIAQLPTGGGLALFTSRRHLDQAVDVLQDLDPALLRERVLVQGAQPRGLLVAEHARRVRAGRPSVLLGLASFGEGLDLPGDLCRHLWIAKLPFGSPDDPVGEARARWVEEGGGNAFSDLVVPATGVRLAQWTGRGIRSETDTARITIYDSRLVDQPWGRRLLAGLPPYPVEVLPAP